MERIGERAVVFLPWNSIEAEAQQQIMNTAKMPFVFRHVAVMPDCHYGKGATVGTVLPTDGAIIPAAVGVDIGCRMHLTIFDTPPDEFLRRRDELFADLRAVTVFGTGAARGRPADHEILDDARWSSARSSSTRASSRIFGPAMNPLRLNCSTWSFVSI